MMDFERFFQGLSDRMWKENGLSDITYALCRGNSVFLRFFTDFFFHEFNLDPASLSIEREYDDGRGNRPDFRVTDRRNGVFFIEVKIWDRNHHFGPYVESLKQENHADNGAPPLSTENAKKRLGYIAAYDISPSDAPESEGCAIRTWEQIYSELKRWSFFEDDTIRAYGSYLSRVCGLQAKTDLDDYRFSPCDFTSIRDFMVEIDTALEDQKNRISPYNGSSRWFRSDAWMGRFFEWKEYAGGNNSVWGWLGAYFGDDTPQVYVWFEDRQGWGNLVCDHFGRPLDETRSVWYSKYDKSLYVWMTARDKGDLKSFFKRALLLLEGIFDSREIDPFPKKGDLPKRFNSLLSMRKLPMSIEKWIVSSKNDETFRIVSTGRDENPFEHSRVNFRVEVESQDMTKSISGWVGVDFGSDVKTPKLSFRLEGESPSGECELAVDGADGDLSRMTKTFRSKITVELKNRGLLTSS